MLLLVAVATLCAQSKEPPPIKWAFETAEPIRCAPTVAEGVAYVVASLQNPRAPSDPSELPKGGKLHAVDLATGREKWSVEFDGYTTGMTPTVGEGIVAIGGSSVSTQAFDAATGEFKYRLKADSNRPVCAQGILLCAALGGMTASDIRNGRKMWTHRSDGSVSVPAIVSDGTVFYTTAVTMFALDAKTARVLWQHHHDAIGTLLTYCDGHVLGLAPNGTLFAVDAKSGKPAWTTTVDRPLTGVPAAAGGLFLFGSEDGHVYAIDVKSGKPQWKYAADTNVSAVSIRESHAYGAGADGRVHAFALKDGAPEWTFKTGAELTAAPVVADGLLLIGGGDKKLHALELPK